MPMSHICHIISYDFYSCLCIILQRSIAWVITKNRNTDTMDGVNSQSLLSFSQLISIVGFSVRKVNCRKGK